MVDAKLDRGVLLLFGHTAGSTLLTGLTSVGSTTCRVSYFLEQRWVVWVQAEQAGGFSGPTVRCGTGDAIRGQGGKRVMVRGASSEVMHAPRVDGEGRNGTVGSTQYG